MSYTNANFPDGKVTQAFENITNTYIGRDTAVYDDPEIANNLYAWYVRDSRHVMRNVTVLSGGIIALAQKDRPTFVNLQTVAGSGTTISFANANFTLGGANTYFAPGTVTGSGKGIGMNGIYTDEDGVTRGITVNYDSSYTTGVFFTEGIKVQADATAGTTLTVNAATLLDGTLTGATVTVTNAGTLSNVTLAGTTTVSAASNNTHLIDIQAAAGTTITIADNNSTYLEGANTNIAAGVLQGRLAGAEVNQGVMTGLNLTTGHLYVGPGITIDGATLDGGYIHAAGGNNAAQRVTIRNLNALTGTLALSTVDMLAGQNTNIATGVYTQKGANVKVEQGVLTGLDMTAGRLYVADGITVSGGTLNGTAAKDQIFASSGAVVDNLTFTGTGLLTVEEGAKLLNIQAAGDALVVSAASGGVISGGNFGAGVKISAYGASISGANFSGGAVASAMAGTVVSGGTVSGGAVLSGNNAEISGAVISNGGILRVLNEEALAADVVLHSGAVLSAVGATVSGGTFNSGAVISGQGGAIFRDVRAEGVFNNDTTTDAITEIALYGGTVVSGGVFHGIGVNNTRARKGGIYMKVQNYVELHDVTFTGNAYAWVYDGAGGVYGGVVADSAVLFMRDNTLLSGTTVKDSAYISALPGATIEGVTFADDAANTRNALLTSGAIISNCTLSGGIYSVTAAGNTFRDNVMYGGTLSMDAAAGAAIDNLAMYGGTAQLYSGAALTDLKLGKQATLSMNGGTVENLQAAGAGVKLFVSGGGVISGATFEGIGVPANRAGGVSAFLKGMTLKDFSLYGNAFINLEANTQASGAIVSDSATLWAHRKGSLIDGATVYGDGQISAYSDGQNRQITVSNVTFIGGGVNSRNNLVMNAGVLKDCVASSGAILRFQAGSYEVQSVVENLTVSAGANVRVDYDKSDYSTSVIFDTLANFDAGVVFDVTGVEAGNTYALATVGNTALSVNCKSGVYLNTVSVGTDYTNAATGMTYSFDGSSLTTTAFTANSVDAAAALSADTASKINGNADLAAKWDGDTAVTSGSVYLASDMTAGAAWLELDGYNGADTNIFGAQGTSFENGTVNIYANNGTIANLAGGANKNGTVANVNLTFDSGAKVNGLALAGGQGNVTGAVKTYVYGGTFGSSFVAGTYSNKVGTEVGSVELTIGGGTFKNNVFGGSQIKYVSTAATSTVDDITVKLTNVEKVNYGFSLYAGGIAAGSSQDKNAYEVGNVTVSVSGGNWSNDAPMGGHGIFGGIFAGDTSTTGNVGVKAAVTGQVAIKVSGGTLGNVYGGGWSQRGAVSSVGSVDITVTGGTVANIFGGGIHSNAYEGNTTVVGDSTSPDAEAVNITVKGGSVTNNIYARGQSSGDYVYGVSVVKFEGAGTHTCNVYGYDYVGGPATGVSNLEFDGYNGSISGSIAGFDRITFAGNVDATLGEIENIDWEFDLSDRNVVYSNCAMLNWAGDLSVSGNTVSLRLASDASTSDSWIIADGLTGAASSYELYLDDAAAKFTTATLDTAISGTGTEYDGWKLTFEDSTLKFAKVTA